MVLRRCRQMLRDEDAALDAMQDVFARWLELDRQPPEFPSSFLYTMATRICIDRMRSAAYRHGGNDALLADIASAEDIEAVSGARRLLDRIFRRHEADTRTMAVLHYVDGLTHEEVAEQVNLSAAGVRRRLQRLREQVASLKGFTGSGRDNGWAMPAASGKESV